MKLKFSFFILLVFYFFNFNLHASQIYTIHPTQLTQTLYYSGVISPIQSTPVISPTEGVVDQENFIYGEMVQQGQVLLNIQTQKIQNDLRDAQVAYLKALDDYQSKLNWQSSDDVINAQESLNKAKRALAESKNTWQENQKLYQLGIISLQDLNQSQDAYNDAISSEQEAERTLTDAKTKGQGDNLTTSKLALQIAQDKFNSLQQQVNTHLITAPADGIVLEPSANQINNTGDGSHPSISGKIAVGSSIQYQQVLLNIGDMSGLRINFQIPEININQITPGQSVDITGAGFPNIKLHGIISEVGAQAMNSDGGSLPSFPAVATVKNLTPAQKKLIKSGMDAQLAIQIYQANQQIMIPIQAVTQNKNGESIIKFYDPKTNKTSDRVIKTGKVMANSVQVLSGLAAGDEIKVSQ